MEKVTIDGVEYDVEALKASISKAEDYTQKTQTLADEKRALAERAQAVEAYENLQQYAEQTPEFKKRLEKLMKTEAMKIQGGSIPDDESDDEEFESGSDYLDSDKSKGKKKAKVATQDDVQKAVNTAIQQVMSIQQQNEVQKEIQREFLSLKDAGYTADELTKVGTYAKAKGVLSPRVAADALIGGEALPNRFKKKPEEDPIPFLKGRAASGYNIPEPEKELVKYGGDPSEMLKANLDKLFIADD